MKKILAVAMAAFLFAGCAARVKTVTDLPAGVTQQQAQQWDSAVADLHKIAATVSTLRQSLTDLHTETLLTDEYYADALRAVAHMDQLELAAEAVLRQAPSHFTTGTKTQVASYVTQILAELQKLVSTGAAGIKSAGSQQAVEQILQEGISVVNLVLTLTGSTPVATIDGPLSGPNDPRPGPRPCDGPLPCRV